MEFVITEYKHCDLIEIHGRIDSYSAPQIEMALKGRIVDGQHNFVVNLAEVTFISSSGILLFVNFMKQFLRQKQGEIVFANSPNLIMSSFKLAGFDQLFKFYDDTLSAVGSF